LPELEQCKYKAVVGTEPSAQFVAQIAGDGRAFDVAARAQVAQTLVQVGRFFLTQVADAALAAPLQTPQFVITGPHRDPGQPRNERLLVAPLIIIQREIGFDKTLLDDFLNLITAWKEAIAEPRHQTAMAVEQPGEG